MRKWLLVLLLTFAFVLPAMAGPPEPGGTDLPITAVIVPEEGAQLAAAPIETAEKTGQLMKGAPVTVETLGVYWCRVSDGAQSGFVPTAALHFDDWGAPGPQSAAAPEIPRLAVFNVGMSPGGHWTMTLRETDSRKGAPMDTCIAGTVMIVLAQGKEFTLVHTGGKAGYLLTKYLSFHSAAQTPERYAVVSNDDQVNLRYDRRFGDSGIITALESGTVVTLIWEKKGWAYVETGGYQGYVVSEFLVILN